MIELPSSLKSCLRKNSRWSTPVGSMIFHSVALSLITCMPVASAVGIRSSDSF